MIFRAQAVRHGEAAPPDVAEVTAGTPKSKADPAIKRENREGNADPVNRF